MRTRERDDGRGISGEKAVLPDMIKRAHVKVLKGESCSKTQHSLQQREKAKCREQEKSVKHNQKICS